MEFNGVKTGDIIAFNSKFKAYKSVTYLSWLIRKVAKVKYNHTGVIVYVWGIPMVYESMGHGFKSTPLRDRIFDIPNDGIAIIRRKEHIDEREFAKEATSLLGHVSYDIPGLFDQLYFAIFRKWKKRTEKEAKENMYCWESTMYLHRKSNLFKNWWEIDPSIYFKNEKFEYVFSDDNVSIDTYRKLEK